MPAVRPPIFTIARPFVVDALLPVESTIGIMERIVVELVIKIGRRRVAPASTRAVLSSIVIRY